MGKKAKAPNPKLGNADKRIRRIHKLTAAGWSEHRIVCAIVEEFKICERQAYEDKARAQIERAPQNAAEQLKLKEIAARKWERREFVAEQAGKLSDANYAFDKWCKVMGAYAPKQVHISGTVGVSVRIDAIVKVLDADGMAALRVVQEQIARAKAAGLLAPPPVEVAPPELADKT